MNILQNFDESKYQALLASRAEIIKNADPAIFALILQTFRDAVRKHDFSDNDLYYLYNDVPPEAVSLVMAEIAIIVKEKLVK